MPEKADDLFLDLNQIGTLIDVQRLKDEDNCVYLKRLSLFFK